MSGKITFSILAAALLASACVSVLPEAQTPEALIRLPMETRAASSPLNAHVVVHLPDAPGAFAGVEIASANGQQIRYINGVVWADTPAKLLQSALVDALTAAGGDGRATAVQTGVRGEYELRWSVRDLSVNNNTREAICAIRLVLTRQRGREVVATQDLRSVEPLSGLGDVLRAEALARAIENAASTAGDFVSEHAEPIDWEALREERRLERAERRKEEFRKFDKPPENQGEDTPEETPDAEDQTTPSDV